MKKLFLLLAASSIGLSSWAQQINKTASSSQQIGRELSSAANNELKKMAAHKTTAVTSRWYNYVDPFDTSVLIPGNSFGQSQVLIWNDTAAKINYTTGGLAHNHRLSMGEVIEPQWHGYYDGTNAHPGFNSPYFPGMMYLPSSAAYTVDSIMIFGVYNINPVKTAVVDTIVITYMSSGRLGAGFYSGASNATFMGHYGLTGSDSLWVAEPRYNTATNTQMSLSGGTGFAPVTIKYPLSHANWADTNAFGTMVKSIGLTTPLTATAGEFVSVSVSFKSGDASFPAGGDTVTDYNTGRNKYNYWAPLVYYNLNGTTVDWCNPHYSKHPIDWNSGYFAQNPPYDSTSYSSMYAWSNATTGGAYFTQHVNIGVHVVCPTCDVEPNAVNSVVSSIKNVGAYPNPATKELNVFYSLVNGGNATITLTNSVGQVVASQTSNSGKVTFNTASLPAGFYVYSVLANGERSTGNVDIAH